MTDALFSRRLEALQRDFFADHRANILNGTPIKKGTEWSIGRYLYRTITNGQFEAIGGNYGNIDAGNPPVLNTAETVNVASSSVNDDGDPLGTGAHQVDVLGYSRSGATSSYVFERVTLNGTNNVLTSTAFTTVLDARTFGTGSLNLNLGNITFTPSVTTGQTFGHIEAFQNTSRMATFATATGYEAFIRIISTSAQASGAEMQIASINGSNEPCVLGGIRYVSANASHQTTVAYVPENTAIYVAAYQATGGNIAVGANVDVIIRKK